MEKLQVPGNISLRSELWPGFGLPEGIKTAVFVVIGLLASGIYCLFVSPESPNLVVIVAVMISLVLGIGLFQRMENNMSIYNFFMRQVAYKRDQQIFRYQRKEGELQIETEKE